MEKQEWQGYVQKVASCDYPIPLNLINDYDDWKCRSNVGRMLMILKDIEVAMAVLATVKDVQPDMEDAPEFGLSEAEHKVLCLRDIAEIIWRLTGTADAPIIYLNEAYRLCREYKKVFRSADRGAIWARRLELQRSCGAEAAALSEARAMLEAEKAVEGVNAYRFHALKFIAESMAEQGDYAKAAFGRCLQILPCERGCQVGSCRGRGGSRCQGKICYVSSLHYDSVPAAGEG